jgi:hypothetical protein
MPQQSSLCALPLEIIDLIAFELSALTPLGPPSSLTPLLLTCHYLYSSLRPSSKHGLSLYARIFKYKFDSSAVQRRAFKPSNAQYLDQMIHYCRAMKVLRRGDVYASPTTHDNGFNDDNDASDSMFTAFMMMLEDDGRNYRQLLEWAHADVFAEKWVRNRLYEGRNGNDGWPRESNENSCAMWLMWMFTTEGSFLMDMCHTRSVDLMTIL